MHRLFLFSTIAATLAACSENNCNVNQLDEATCQHFQLITGSVYDGDAATFASLCKYPVWRPYPLRWIEDSVQMVEYFPILVDDSLKKICRDITHDDWWQAGWRGYTFGDGSYIWDDYGTISINYISAAESALINILSRHELESLHPELRQGATPYFCFIDEADSTIYRIDITDNTADSDDISLRLAIYPHGCELNGLPYTLMPGTRTTEGSAHVQRLTFNNDKGESLYFIYDPSEYERRTAAHITIGDSTVTHPIHFIYWRDYAHRH